MPLEYRKRYETVMRKIIDLTTPWFESAKIHRVHGDCHPGNLLSNSEGFFFLDFDDMVQGPAAQDIWMVVPGRDRESLMQREVLLEGYSNNGLKFVIAPPPRPQKPSCGFVLFTTRLGSQDAGRIRRFRRPFLNLTPMAIGMMRLATSRINCGTL